MFTKGTSEYRPLPLPDRFDFTEDQSLREARAFYDRMRRRHTVRDFAPQPVGRSVIDCCIQTAGTAPSGAKDYRKEPCHGQIRFVGSRVAVDPAAFAEQAA